MKLTKFFQSSAAILALSFSGLFASTAQSAIVTDIDLNLNGGYIYAPGDPAFLSTVAGRFDFDINALDLYTDAYYWLEVDYDIWANGYNLADTFSINISDYFGAFSLDDAYTAFLPESALLLDFFSQPANVFAGDIFGIDVFLAYVADPGSTMYSADGDFTLVLTDDYALEHLLGDYPTVGEFDITFSLLGDDGQPASVTEPAIISLLGIGLVGLAFSRRSKKNK